MEYLGRPNVSCLSRCPFRASWIRDYKHARVHTYCSTTTYTYFSISSNETANTSLSLFQWLTFLLHRLHCTCSRPTETRSNKNVHLSRLHSSFVTNIWVYNKINLSWRFWWCHTRREANSHLDSLRYLLRGARYRAGCILSKSLINAHCTG